MLLASCDQHIYRDRSRPYVWQSCSAPGACDGGWQRRPASGGRGTYARKLDAAVAALGRGALLLDVEIPQVATRRADDAHLVRARIVPSNCGFSVLHIEVEVPSWSLRISPPLRFMPLASSLSQRPKQGTYVCQSVGRHGDGKPTCDSSRSEISLRAISILSCGAIWRSALRSIRLDPSRSSVKLREYADRKLFACLIGSLSPPSVESQL